MARVVPPSVTRAAGDMESSAVWRAGPVASNAFLVNVPIFTTHATSILAVPNLTATAIPLAGGMAPGYPNPVDSDNGHSNTTDNTKYIAQVSGWYVVSGVVSWVLNATGYRQSYLTKNGGVILGSAVTVNATAADFTAVPTGTVVVQLNVTDYVELWGFQSSGGSLNTDVGAIEGCFLHAWWVAHS